MPSDKICELCGGRMRVKRSFGRNGIRRREHRCLSCGYRWTSTQTKDQSSTPYRADLSLYRKEHASQQVLPFPMP